MEVTANTNLQSKKRKYHELTPFQSDDDTTSGSMGGMTPHSQDFQTILRSTPKKIRKLNLIKTETLNEVP